MTTSTDGPAPRRDVLGGSDGLLYDVRREVIQLEARVFDLWQRSAGDRDASCAERLAEVSRGLRAAAKALEPDTLYDGRPHEAHPGAEAVDETKRLDQAGSFGALTTTIGQLDRAATA